MSSFLDKYKTNRSAEEEGVWVDFGGGVRVKIRRINSDKSKEVRRRLEKPYAKIYRNVEMPESLQEELLNKQLAEAVIADWEGIPELNEHGEPVTQGEGDQKVTRYLACNYDNILKMVSQFKDFREDVMTASMERVTYQVDDRKVSEGN